MTPSRLIAPCVLSALAFTSPSLIAKADIGVVSPADAKKLIDDADPAKKPIVLDTRGGYKDYFRGHLPTAHHLKFDTLRGTDNGVPVHPGNRRHLPAGYN